MIISPQSLDTNLSQLLAEVKSGSMQLPEFQRDWTWDDNRIRGIIASLDVDIWHWGFRFQRYRIFHWKSNDYPILPYL